MKLHEKALRLLEKDDLAFTEKEFVLENYHEGATNMNNLISAHFTPYQIAISLEQCSYYENFVDLGAGIGSLAWYFLRAFQMGNCTPEKMITGICVENCVEYYEIGKKLLPEFHWINGDMFDKKVIEEIKYYTAHINKLQIISNPPYGRMVKTDTSELLKYTSSEFEYKTIELGALLGGNYGTFLLPQNSCSFKMSGNYQGSVYLKDHELDKKYKKFVKDTGLEISANNGFTTDIGEDNENWKDVTITTEIAIVDYDELDYTPKKQPVKIEQTALF